MELGKLPVQEGKGCSDIFSLVYHFIFLSPSLWETARYRLKYCLKGPLSPKQPTNQPSPASIPIHFKEDEGWPGGSMVLSKLPVPGRPVIWIIVGQGPTALAVGAGGGCLDIFTLIYPFFPLSPSLWETEILSQRAVKPRTIHPSFKEDESN